MKGGKPGAAARMPGHKGAGEHAGSGEAHEAAGDKPGSAEPVAEGHGSGEAHEAAGPGSGDKAAGADEHAGSGEHAGSAEPQIAEGHGGEGHDAADAGVGSADEASAASDGGPPAPLSKQDQALQDIAKLMASTKKQVNESSDRAREKQADKADKPDKDDKRDKADKPEGKPEDKHAAKKPEAKPDKPASPLWAYDGKTGPDAWAKLDPAWRACSDGKAQSPIDIAPRPGNASPIVFHYAPTTGTIRDDGHALQVDLAPGNSIEIDDHTYQLVQIQLHRPSEHAFAGEHYPLEVQLVHKDSKNRLAMISVLYDAGAESRALGALWSKWPRKVGLEDKLRGLDPEALLPDTRTVFRYTGSLTRPPCTEGVVWNVMRRTMTESKAKLDALGQHYKINGRETQPLNGRKVE